MHSIQKEYIIAPFSNRKEEVQIARLSKIIKIILENPKCRFGFSRMKLLSVINCFKIF